MADLRIPHSVIASRDEELINTWREMLSRIGGEALKAWLRSVNNQTLAADKGIYATSASAAATFDLTAFARTLLDDPDAATMLATLGAQADLDVPSQAEAEAGAATTERVWTALRVAQAISALAPTATAIRPLGAVEASGSPATLDWTLASGVPADYSAYEFYISNFLPSADGRAQAQVYEDGSLITTASYTNQFQVMTQDVYTDGIAGDTTLRLGENQESSVSVNPMHGKLTILDPADSGHKHSQCWTIYRDAAAGQTRSEHNVCRIVSTGALDGIQFSNAGGNISSLHVEVIGVLMQ